MILGPKEKKQMQKVDASLLDSGRLGKHPLQVTQTPQLSIASRCGNPSLPKRKLEM